MVWATPYLKNEFGDPRFFLRFLSNLIIFYRQLVKVLKKSVCGKFLGVNVHPYLNFKRNAGGFVGRGSGQTQKPSVGEVWILAVHQPNNKVKQSNKLLFQTIDLFTIGKITKTTSFSTECWWYQFYLHQKKWALFCLYNKIQYFTSFCCWSADKVSFNYYMILNKLHLKFS